MNRIKDRLKKLIEPLAASLFPLEWKRYNELRFWKNYLKTRGRFSNTHYVYFYTTHFGLETSDYCGKVILDIGCGPMGSLEWASMAARRIGLGPLAGEYLKLGAAQHQMEYMKAPSENIPLGTGECQVVLAFNSLDHVDDIFTTIMEIKRITQPGGIFLLLVEVNHPPTSCEPINLSPKFLLEAFQPEFACETIRLYQPVFPDRIYESIKADMQLPHPQDSAEHGYLSARFRRLAAQ